MDSLFYNAEHAPNGAFATFTLGAKGRSGGIAAEMGAPANEDFYIGLQDAADASVFHALPFYEESESERGRYESESDGDESSGVAFLPGLHQIPDEAINRTLTACTDSWEAGDLRFSIIAPIVALPDAEAGDSDALTDATCPVVYLRLEIDNSSCDHERLAFLGWQSSDRYRKMRRIDACEPDLVGIAVGTHAGIAAVQSDGVESAGAFSMREILAPAVPENLRSELGAVRALRYRVPAGTKAIFDCVVGFYRDGVVTAGLPCRYWYTRRFDSLEAVLRHGCARVEQAHAAAVAGDHRFERATLSEERRWQLAHSLHSHYASTMLLEREDGRPLYVVNEGEYRMMNTFDLTVDHCFHELALNPWTLRNVLDLFVERYSYSCGVAFPGEEEIQPGGLSFTHDMGVGNCFSMPGHSSYEATRLTGCFSYMCGEQLVNWICCAAGYVHATADVDWLHRQETVLRDCAESLANRCRKGIIAADTERVQGGAEITTYDSLDVSLGQARNNGYLAGKTWAAWLLLEQLFRRLGDEDQAQASAKQAGWAAATLCAAADAEGLLPAVIGEDCNARIIPVIEGLVFPWQFGRADAVAADGPYATLIACLKRHLTAVLKPGICLFDDGAWKLSSTSINSWLSKIYLSQAVAEQVLGVAVDPAADRAHVAWLQRDENLYWAWSDQMHDGIALGSKYYPRGVTAVLWL